MKKYGKYEKRPEGETAAAKQPAVKSALLQTYFTSLLCMVLCVTMFFGTSYAWFTSEVNNAANEIYVGTLKVGLFAGDEDLSDSDKKLFGSNIRWEPGYTALETITIKNEGDLAFKYVLNFTDGTIADGGSLSLEEVAKYFDVWVYDHRANNNTEPNPDSYAGINTDSGWVPAGTLGELLAGKSVLDGVMVTVRDSNDETPVNDGTTDGVATEDTYTIALHMSEDASTSVMGHKISLNVKLVAYQMSEEKDGFDNKYDQMVASAEELSEALQNGGTVALAGDIAIKDIDGRVTMNGGVLDGNGNEIVYSGGRNSNDNSVGVVTTSGGTVRNLTISGGKNGRALYVTELTSDLSVSDCILSGAYAFNLNSAEKTDFTITFTDTTFKSWTSYANVMDHAYFTNCKFNDRLRPYGNTTLTGCKFADGGLLDVSCLEAGETVTLINCNYNDTLIEKAVLTATKDEEGNIVVNCDSVLLEIKDGEVVLADSKQN